MPVQAALRAAAEACGGEAGGKADGKKPAVARKPSVKKNLRLPSRFVEEAAADKVRHRQEFSAAHKAATAEINRSSQNVLAISFFSTVKS